MRLKTTSFLLSVVFLAAACGGPTGRIKEEGEGDLIGATKAGPAVFKDLIPSTTQGVLDLALQNIDRRGKMKIAFVGIENRSAEELGDIRDWMYDRSNVIISNSGAFKMISKDYVDTVLREVGRSPKEIMLRQGYDDFISQLRAKGQAPDYLLWGKFTSATSRADDLIQRDYQLTMELVDAESGEQVGVKMSKPVRKEYER